MALMQTMSSARKFTGAGYMTLIRHLDDGTDSKNPDDIYTSGRQVAGAINTSSSKSQTPLPDENSWWPAAQYTTESTMMIGVGYNTRDPGLDRFTKGATRSEKKDVPVWHTNVQREIAEEGGTAGAIKLVKTGGTDPLKIDKDTAIVVRDAWSNMDYKNVDQADPATGEYKVDPDAGIFTFSKDDVGKQVFISCALVAEEAVVLEQEAMSKNATYTLILAGPDEDYGETDGKWVEERYDSVQIGGELADIARQKAPGNFTVNFTAVKPRAGYKAVTTTFIEPLV